MVGHADGVVRFVNGETVVDDNRPVDREYGRMLMRKFKEGGLEVAEIPYRPESESSDGMQVNSVIVVPTYANADNKQALDISTWLSQM